MALLEVENLSISIATEGRLLPVVKEISFEVPASGALGIVGESGCGKSLTALAVMGLTEGTPVRIAGGAIRFEGTDITRIAGRPRRALMGDRMAMVFQEPMTSLNPVYRIGDQIAEAIAQHRRVPGASFGSGCWSCCGLPAFRTRRQGSLPTPISCPGACGSA